MADLRAHGSIFLLQIQILVKFICVPVLMALVVISEPYYFMIRLTEKRGLIKMILTDNAAMDNNLVYHFQMGGHLLPLRTASPIRPKTKTKFSDAQLVYWFGFRPSIRILKYKYCLLNGLSQFLYRLFL